MKYNTEKEHLVLAGYGRTVQEMTRHAMGIADRAERNRCAQTIVRIMGTLTGQNPYSGEGRQKLWDHLAEISDYQLDVDYPVAITPKEERTSKPQPLPYPMHRIRSRQYGRYVEASLERLTQMSDSPLRERLTGLVANQMKRLLSAQLRDSRHEERVTDDIARYTDGTVSLRPDFRFASPNVKCAQGNNALVGKKRRKK